VTRRALGAATTNGRHEVAAGARRPEGTGAAARGPRPAARPRMTTSMNGQGRTALRWAACAAALVAALAGTGCSSTCTGDCDHELEQCLRRAPPGAARSDCYAKHQQCVQSCESTR
jgi:hypothetical protein